MNKRQEQILNFAKKNQSFKNKDLVEFFNNEYSRETITRDLSFLSKNKILSKNGAGSNIYYSLMEGYKILENIDVEKYFSTPYFERQIQEGFNFDIFNVLNRDIFTLEEKEKLNILHNKFIKNFSKYDSQTIINKEFERIMIEFSWKSSVIEGNTYSLLGTEALIKNNIIGKGKTTEETQMILNHKDAFNEAIQNKERFLKLKPADIEYIHSVVTKKLNIPRNIRKEGVGITGTNYKPLDNEMQIREAMHNMVDLINKKELFFEKALLASLLISYIQIFEDGNKRTSRMISNAILLAHNSVPLSYRIVDVEEYKKAIILFYEKNNISYFKKIFIDQFEDSVNNYFKEF